MHRARFGFMVLALVAAPAWLAAQDGLSAARSALEEYFRAWNAADNVGIAAASNFPRLSLGMNGQVVVREGPDEIATDFDLLRQAEGWDHTTLDLIRGRSGVDGQGALQGGDQPAPSGWGRLPDGAGTLCGHPTRRPLGLATAVGLAAYVCPVVRFSPLTCLRLLSPPSPRSP